VAGGDGYDLRRSAVEHGHPNPRLRSAQALGKVRKTTRCPWFGPCARDPSWPPA
jgi:hypothetical protein